MEYLTLLLLFSIACAIHIFISSIGSRNSKPAKHPPGPRPFPFVGNILKLGSNPHQTLTDLSKIYGPIMTLKLGNITTIAISSPEIAKEALQENDLAISSRTIPDSVKALDHHKLSVVWMPPSAKWKTLRRACVTKVFSPQQLDSTQILRQRKVQELLDYVNDFCKKGEALDIGDATFTTMLNSISNTFFSIDLAHYASDKSQVFKDIILGIVQEAGRPNVSDFFPICGLVDPQGMRARMTKYFGKLIAIFDGIIEEKMSFRALKLNTKEHCDVLDSFLDLIGEESPELSRLDVLHLFVDLFVARIDTTSSTLEWAMAELLHHPDKLKKARKEIQQVLGKDGRFEESHISKFPFLHAVVKETLRLHPPAPLLAPRKSNDNVEISSFIVPKNAQILVNVWAMGRDSSIWTNPNSFMPERFLESKIDFNGHNFEFIPFGAGRRICPGLPLANRSMHLILASLLQSYDWELADDLKSEDMETRAKYGITLHRAQPLRAIPIQT